jgi:hypothetical protein
MKKGIIALTTGIVLLTGTIGAQSQLSRWHLTATDEIDFTVSPPSLTVSGTPFPGSDPYNNISDNSGNLIFSVAGQSVKNASGTVIGTLPLLYYSSEIAIVPNPGNLTNACQKKYYIVFQHLDGGTLVGTMRYAEVDMNASSGAGSLTVYTTILGNLGSPVNPMAVSRVNSSGKRYLYFAGGVGMAISACEISATGIGTATSIYGGSSGIVTQCNEMELSNAGDKLAFVNASTGGAKSIIVVPINTATGLNTGSPSSITVTGNVAGLEFNSLGTKLFFSKPGSGVYWEDLSTSAVTLISGTSSYGNSMLEKSYGGSEIICATAPTTSTGTIAGITTGTTPALSSWTPISYPLPRNTNAGYTLIMMPDQIDGENYATPVTALVSSFTAPTAICDGSSISLNGSASYGTINGTVISPNPIAAYVWTVVECSSSGVPVSGATEWWSPWGSGAPGAYTLPSYASGGPYIQCGKYYLIKLAVQKNPCVVWAESTKKVLVNCNPVANAGADVTICSNECAEIGIATTPGHGISYQWTSPAGVVGNVPDIIVCPTTTTTYTYTVTNISTGCSASDVVTVTVINNDPSFSMYINTTNPSYFTVQATANYTGGYSVSGFYYGLQIQEMNGSTPYYTHTGTDAWWDYYVHEFRGYVSTGTGTYTQTPWWTSPLPAPGKFLYGHTYKITRTTWNDYCAQQSSYVTITPVRSLTTGETTMAVIPQNGEIPAGTELVAATSVEDMFSEGTIAVYPNPATDKFTIEMSSSVKASIEIFDALGKKVKELQQNGSKSVVDLTGFPKGIYMINIVSEGKLTSKKIALE